MIHSQPIAIRIVENIHVYARLWLAAQSSGTHIECKEYAMCIVTFTHEPSTINEYDSMVAEQRFDASSHMHRHVCGRSEFCFILFGQNNR